MTGTAKLLRNAAFALMTSVGVLGGIFAAGYAFADHETGTAIGSTAPWLVLAVALSVFAVTSRKAAPLVFVGLTLFVAGQTVVDSALGLVPRDEVGPMAAIAVLVTGVALGFLGLRRTSLAGALLVVLGLGQLAATLVGFRGELGTGTGPGLAHVLTTSSGMVVVPVLLAGLLFLAAGVLAHDSLRLGNLPTGARPAH